MSIASAIQAKQQQVADSYTAVSNKGGTLPATQNLTNLATAISSIPSGGTTPVITSLNVTPTTSQQIITAPSGTDGYSPVNVGAVTSSIDGNITAGNIREGVKILGVTGTYSGIKPSGTYNITANGTYNVGAYMYASVQVGGSDEFMTFDVDDMGDIEEDDTDGPFSENLKTIKVFDTGIPKPNSNVNYVVAYLLDENDNVKDDFLFDYQRSYIRIYYRFGVKKISFDLYFCKSDNPDYIGYLSY